MDKLEAKPAILRMSGGEVGLKVTRNQNNWGYFYLIFGLIIGIEGTVIQMITPIVFPYNILIFLFTVLITGFVIRENVRVQNWLLDVRDAYEKKPR